VDSPEVAAHMHGMKKPAHFTGKFNVEVKQQ